MNIRTFSFAVPLVVLSACNSIKDEFYEPDGFIGPHFNSRIVAVTQEQRADRYLIAFALVAPLALETSDNGQDKTNIIARINNTQGALAALYGAAGKPAASLASPEATKFSFESVGYDVQKQLYRLAKELIIQLNLDETAEDIVDLDIPALLRLYNRAKDLFPVVRRGAATYRDTIYIYADAVSDACDGTACSRLEALLLNQNEKGVVTARDSQDRRYFEQVLSAAKSASKETHPEKTAWRLGKSRRLALLYHIQKACDAAFKTQETGENPSATLLNCGTPKKSNASEKRDELIGSFQVVSNPN